MHIINYCKWRNIFTKIYMTCFIVLIRMKDNDNLEHIQTLFMIKIWILKIGKWEGTMKPKEENNILESVLTF